MGDLGSPGCPKVKGDGPRALGSLACARQAAQMAHARPYFDTSMGVGGRTLVVYTPGCRTSRWRACPQATLDIVRTFAPSWG